MLKARRAGQSFIAFNGDGEISFGKRNDRNKSAALEERAAGAVGDGGIFEGEEKPGLDDFVEIGNGGVVDEKDGVFGIVNEGIVAAETNLLAAIVDDKGHEFVLRFAGFVDDERGEKLCEEIAAIGRPPEAIHRVGKGGVGEV